MENYHYGSTDGTATAPNTKQALVATLSVKIMRERKSLFIFLMGLAWKFRFSMPLLLSSTVAMLGRAWMFQIRVQTVQGLHENEMSYYDEDDEGQEDETSTWESGSSSSWETLAEEEAYG